MTNNSTFGMTNWESIIESSTKVMSFIDTGGHSKYSKQLMSALVGLHPDYSFLVVSIVDGVTKSAMEHLSLALALSKPITVLVTKTDLFEHSPEEVEDRLHDIKRSIQSISDHSVIVVNDTSDAINFTRNIGEDIIPLIPLSLVKESNLALFKEFINLLPVSSQWSALATQHTEVKSANSSYISVFNIPNSFWSILFLIFPKN